MFWATCIHYTQILCCWVFLFLRQGPLYIALPGFLKIQYLETAGLKFRDPSASAYGVLGLKALPTAAQLTQNSYHLLDQGSLDFPFARII